MKRELHYLRKRCQYNPEGPQDTSDRLLSRDIGLFRHNKTSSSVSHRTTADISTNTHYRGFTIYSLFELYSKYGKIPQVCFILEKNIISLIVVFANQIVTTTFVLAW